MANNLSSLVRLASALWLAGACWAEPLERYLFTVRRNGAGSGSAFMMKDTNGVWMVSNYHCISGEDEIKFVGMQDEADSFTLPDEIHVATDRDAIRFAVDRSEGFFITDQCSFDQTVFAYGNSDGRGVVTKSEGTVVGKGCDVIEVTCDIIPGNSGGPVIDTSDAVIGIATFIIKAPYAGVAEGMKGSLSVAERARIMEERRMIHGTRYEEVRRFAIPVGDIAWQGFPRKVFEEESAIYDHVCELYDDFRDGCSQVFRLQHVPSGKEEALSKLFVRRYNRERTDLGYYNSDAGRFVVFHRKMNRLDQSYIRWIKTMAKQADKLAGEWRDTAEKLSTDFFRTSIEEFADNLNKRAKEYRGYADELAD